MIIKVIGILLGAGSVLMATDELLFGSASDNSHYAVASLHLVLALTCLSLLKGATARRRSVLLPWLGAYGAGLIAFSALELYAGVAHGEARAFFKIAFVGETSI